MISEYAYSDGLDISQTTPSSLRAVLKPVLSLIVTAQEAPLPLLSLTEKPVIIVGDKFFSFAKPLNRDIISDSQLDVGFSTLWGAVTISQNLKIGGHMSAVMWGGDNLNSSGVVFSTAWGETESQNFFSVSVSHLYGPDDFHMRDIGLTIGRIISCFRWDVALAYTGHYSRCKVHIANSEFPDMNSKTLEMKFNHLRTGIYRHFSEEISLGVEVDVSPSILMLSFSLIGYI